MIPYILTVISGLILIFAIVVNKCVDVDLGGFIGVLIILFIIFANSTVRYC